MLGDKSGAFDSGHCCYGKALTEDCVEQRVLCCESPRILKLIADLPTPLLKCAPRRQHLKQLGWYFSNGSLCIGEPPRLHASIGRDRALHRFKVQSERVAQWLEHRSRNAALAIPVNSIACHSVNVCELKPRSYPRRHTAPFCPVPPNWVAKW
jgi:hypothetical protein